MSDRIDTSDCLRQEKEKETTLRLLLRRAERGLTYPDEEDELDFDE